MGGYWIQPGGDGNYNFMLSTDTGEFFALDNQYGSGVGCPIIYYATLSDSGNALSGSGWAAQSGTGHSNTFGPCSHTPATAMTYSGTVMPGISIDLSAAGADQYDLIGQYQNGDTLTNGVYATPANVAALAGAYPLLSGDTMTVGADGSVNLPEAATGCTYTGTVSVIDPAYSVYRLEVTATGCSSVPAWNGALERGIISFLGSNIYGNDVVFGGTSFTDTMGIAQLKLFQ